MATHLQATAERIASRNPATGELLAEFDCATADEVRAAVAQARASQPAWEAAGAAHRARVLRRFMRLLHVQKREVARVIAQESGKVYVEALVAEVIVTLDVAKYMAGSARAFLRPERVPHSNPIVMAKSAYLLRRPYGVIGVISPWNYPFSIPAGQALAALVMGNAVVLKPSEFTPQTALVLRKLLHQAGVPEDVFQVVLGAGPTGAALVEAGLDKLVLTGSVPTGRRIAQAAAARLLPVLLELGGKDAMLVLDDADVEIASSAAVWGAFLNAGQTCLSVERCYVHRSLYESFVERCAAKTQELRVGPALEEHSEVGPLIHERQLRVVEEHVADALARGARLIAGGQRLPGLGPNFYAPTVLAGVTHEMRIMREETFGPVLPIMAFATDDEAVRLANDSDFGLSASVWTRDKSRGRALAARLQAGTVMVNDVLTCFGIAEAPHGGVKSSGMGRTHGRFGLEEMVQLKYVDSDWLPRLRKAWWYGYGPAFTAQMEAFADALFAPGPLRRLRGWLGSAGAFFRKRQI
jgi:acyl-CoA reductase-like NAD-dependent aldehyde dehydrogenase